MHTHSTTRPASGLTAARFGRRGFTLVEMTMVVLLLALLVLAVVMVAAMAFRDRELLKNEARFLAGYLENIRSLAALHGKTYTVQYDLDEQRFFVWEPRRVEQGEVYESNDDENRVASGFHPMPTRYDGSGQAYYQVWIDRVGYGDGTTSRERNVRVDFLPTGGSHWHVVYLSNEAGEFYSIEVNPFTGFAEIYPGQLEIEPPRKAER
ncbi:MAG: hypothetical protein KF696_01000 [Planctomycetes bacterium]|nr:hypothetical protein [Planctomycetota bacterium]MCW8134483.1 hypothetical protein [Planctomycetota bacterium]